MKKQFIVVYTLFFSLIIYAQSGHIMQGIGAVNMSMGGAATAQPLDINGALQWNPAAISGFDGKIISLSAGAFFSSPTLKSSLPAGMLGPGAPAVSGVTEDDRGTSIMPALAFVWGKKDSKHTFGVSAFGISGFGVDFPEETNSPLAGANFNPNNNSNPISYPQAARGFGHIKSNYILMQVSLAYAYKLTNKISIGIQPNFNYESLELAPNPTANPDMTGKGYPTTDVASALGYGAQVGIFYDSHDMLKLGVSYKTKQYFSEFTFKNTYLDGTAAPDNNFTMNYPAILSFGMGLSGKKLDFAADIRFVNYKDTEGFAESGWKINEANGFPTGAVNGFGWRDMTIFSVGLQYKLLKNLPVRIGYTNNTNPITDELAFYSVSAPAVITHAAQIGLGYTFGKLDVNVVYHKGFRGDGNTGVLLNPGPDQDLTGNGFPEGPWNAFSNPLGEIPGTSVSYDMETSMIQLTLSYKLL